MEPKIFSWKNKLKGISDKALAIHTDKLYQGYVKKSKEISEKLREFATGAKDLSSAHHTYSELRGLKEGETFAVNGVYLHEWYFGALGGSGVPEWPLADALKAKFGTIEQFLAYFKANGMAARGWAVLAWDAHEADLRIYTADAHNQGGVWGAIPVLVLDVYEHAYFMDYGSDKAKYIDDFLGQIDWEAANALYLKAMQVKL